MKTRRGFVSNSSSTSFTFCFKGRSVKALSDVILTQYRDRFRLSYDEYHCNALDIIEAIERVAQTSGRLKTIKEHMEFIKTEIENNESEIAEEGRESMAASGSGCFYTFLQERKQELERQLVIFKQAEKRGLNTVLVIGFGDNDGDVSGGDIGMAMDYEGRNISIDAKDLVVFTEQNR